MSIQGKRARIYQLAKNAMQSGTVRCSQWILEFDPEVKTSRDPIMGWISSSDMRQELRLLFATSQEAITYAERYGIIYRLEHSYFERGFKKKNVLSYSNNFRPDRPLPWTH